MNETRKYWIKTLFKIVTPVLSNMAEGRLKATMPVEGKSPDRPAVTHLEALGRTLTGLAPWLEIGNDANLALSGDGNADLILQLIQVDDVEGDVALTVVIFELMHIESVFHFGISFLNPRICTRRSS